MAITTTLREPAVGKKTDGKQVTFRLPDDLHARLQAAAEGLALDISSLLRTMIRKHLNSYEREAREIREREEADRQGEDASEGE